MGVDRLGFLDSAANSITGLKPINDIEHGVKVAMTMPEITDGDFFDSIDLNVKVLQVNDPITIGHLEIEDGIKDLESIENVQFFVFRALWKV